MTARERLAWPGIVRGVLLMGLACWLLRCGTSVRVPPPPPAPAPTPTPAPVTCGLPVPQEQFACIGPPDGSKTLSSAVGVAIFYVVSDNPKRFELMTSGTSATTVTTYLLTEDHKRAKNEEAGAPEARAWLHAQVVAQMQKGGWCAGSFGQDALVVSETPNGTFQVYRIVNAGGGNVHREPPAYQGNCVANPPVVSNPFRVIRSRAIQGLRAL